MQVTSAAQIMMYQGYKNSFFSTQYYKISNFATKFANSSRSSKVRFGISNPVCKKDCD